MNYKEPEAMKEIHEIRLKLHKDRKGLNAIEKAKRTNKAAALTLMLLPFPLPVFLSLLLMSETRRLYNCLILYLLDKG